MKSTTLNEQPFEVVETTSVKTNVRYDALVAIRACKATLVAAVAFFLTLAVFNNISDYYTNFRFVEHVMRMNTIYPDSSSLWRAVASPFFHHLLYGAIITWQIVTAVLCWWGTYRCWYAVRSSKEAFYAAKVTAIIGLTSGLLLWIIGFIAIGGEWFLMWQSEDWNGHNSAFRAYTIMGVILLFLNMPEH